MAENGLSERIERIENTLDTQFLEVRDHFVEQRQYTELAYDRLRKQMTEGFTRLDGRVDGLDERMTEGFTRLERKIDQLLGTRSRATTATQRRARPSKRRR